MKFAQGTSQNVINENLSNWYSSFNGSGSQTGKDDKVYMGGNPNFDETTGKFTGPDSYKNFYNTNPPSPQQFKTDYADNLKNYMTINTGGGVKNTNTSANNNLDQDVGNKEDWTTNINNSTLNYSNVGNDYSVNIGGIGDGFSNMQGAAAYTALNNNQYYRSNSEVNGLKRAAQASEQATGLVGAKDRAANLYNSMGYSQNYWRQKADAQQNFYLGDIYSQGAPDFVIPDPPVSNS
jgi:hypothetical protein